MILARRRFAARPAWIVLGVLALASTAIPRVARAADGAAEQAEQARQAGQAREDERLPRGLRVGVEPGVGLGLGGLVNVPSSIYPSFVGLTSTHVEIVAEAPRLAFFVRGAFYSSGSAGRWTAPAVYGGAGYRLFGDGETSWGLLVRGGLGWERWHAEIGPCDIPLFYPDNCKDFPPAGPSGKPLPPYPRTTVNTWGLLGGVRLELPLRPVYVALGAEAMGMVDIGDSEPSLALHAQFSISFAMRNHQTSNESVNPPAMQPHFGPKNTGGAGP